MNKPLKLNRRGFFRLAGASLAAWIAVACQAVTLTPPKKIMPKPTPAFTPAGQVTPVSSAPTPVPTPSPLPQTPTPDRLVRGVSGPPYTVAIAQASSYDRGLIRRQVEILFDQIGGIGDVVRKGDRVAIKPNLTCGNLCKAPGGIPATECYATHPEVVRAVAELCLDAGAKSIFIVEAIYDFGSYSSWGYAEIANDLSALLVDLNLPAPYPNFISAPVGPGSFIYDQFTFNPILLDVDAFISVAKLKAHHTAGVTLSMKNLFGLTPYTHYRLDPAHTYRSAFHDPDGYHRVPQVILDLNRARPVNLAIIDGVRTASGGEIASTPAQNVRPGVLLAGKNPVATDTVAAAVMSFDPAVEAPNAPFLHAINHLKLAADLGLGPNRLDLIQVAGTPINAAAFPFEPGR